MKIPLERQTAKDPEHALAIQIVRYSLVRGTNLQLTVQTTLAYALEAYANSNKMENGKQHD